MKGRKPDQNAIRRGLKDSYALASPDERVGIGMPADIASDPVQSEIWAMIAPPTNRFAPEDEPNLRLLVYWHAVANQARKMMQRQDGNVGILEAVAISPFTTQDGRQKPLFRKSPALSVLKEASAEIRALSDQLGLSPLARSRIGLMDATTIKTAADTAAMFAAIDDAYGRLPESEVLEIEAIDAQD